MANWFIDRTSITVNKEPVDDISLYVLGGASKSVSDATTGAFPFLCEVAVTTTDKIVAFLEDMYVYEYEPQYTLNKTAWSVLRFRGASNNIYTFIGVKPSSDTMAAFVSDQSTRTSKDNVFAKNTNIAECTGSTLGIIIYDQNFQFVNPLALAVNKNVFTSKGPASSSQSVVRTSQNGIVSVIDTGYFTNNYTQSANIAPPFGQLKLPPPPEVPQTATVPLPAGKTATKDQKGNNSQDTNSQDGISDADRNKGRPPPKARAQNAEIKKGGNA